MLSLNHPPVAKAKMLIRTPVADVFEAFVDPAITSKFWFTKGSGRLEAGKKIRWEWEMYGISDEVEVKEIEKNKGILIAWGSYGAPTTAELRFTSRAPGETFVSITNSGFGGEGDSAVSEVIQSTEGFALVLAGLKAFLEHGIVLNAVADRHPDAWVPR
jgi:uncharacterized protein YndB with AHSA1/START domain